MLKDKRLTVFPRPCSAQPIRIDAEKCGGCLRCAEACQVDVLAPVAGAGKPPAALFPGECYFCGSCVMACPTGAISLRHPLMNQAKFVPVAKEE